MGLDAQPIAPQNDSVEIEMPGRGTSGWRRQRDDEAIVIDAPLPANGGLDLDDIERDRIHGL